MNVKTIFVRPRDGRVTLMPELNYQAVPKEGTEVYLSAFYHSAVRNGDLEIFEPTPEPLVDNAPVEVSAASPNSTVEAKAPSSKKG
jgi:hypothetical protein